MRTRPLALASMLAFGPLAAAAGDRLELTGLLDVRAVYTDADTSFLNGGSGRLRFDKNHDGLRLGRALLAAKFRVSDIWTVNVVGGSYGDYDKNPLDVTEAWLEARPYPTGSVRYRVRLGAFQLPASLENRSTGWTTPYSITPSAINTWLGEEIRIVGSEFEAKWLGATHNYDGDIAFTAGAYGWNDPAGALIADRGWALTDRQSTLWGGLARPRIEFIREVDHKPGYYAGLTWRHHDRLEIRALRYDNRADPGATSTDNIAWRTQFTSLGLRWEPDDHWTVIGQSLQGWTYVGGDANSEDQYAESFRSWFVLGSYGWNSDRITLRYDHFSTRQHSGFYGAPTNDDGHALVFAYLHDFDDHWQAVGEWQQVRSGFPPRVDAGEPETINESQIQLSIRYRFSLQR